MSNQPFPQARSLTIGLCRSVKSLLPLPLHSLPTGYSPLDLSTLDPHWGHRNEWRTMMDAVHARGMYYVVDFMVATMGNLIAWKG